MNEDSSSYRFTSFPSRFAAIFYIHRRSGKYQSKQNNSDKTHVGFAEYQAFGVAVIYEVQPSAGKPNGLDSVKMNGGEFGLYFTYAQDRRQAVLPNIKRLE
jgi:hypothetical protein